jgi:YD repeat-containing protein
MATTTWTYDAAGLLTTSVSKSGATTNRHTDNVYDKVGRLTEAITYQGSGTGTPKIRTTVAYRGDGSRESQAVYLDGSGTASDTLTFTYQSAVPSGLPMDRDLSPVTNAVLRRRCAEALITSPSRL